MTYRTLAQRAPEIIAWMRAVAESARVAAAAWSSEGAADA